MELLFGILISGFVSWIAAPFLLKLAFHYGWLDVPTERKKHDRPTPLVGGWLIFIGWLAALLFLQEIPWVLLLSSTAILLLGWFDDLKPQPALLKFLILIGTVLLFLGTTQATFPLLPWAWLNFLLAIVWLVGLSCAINFLDGVDGLVGGLSLIYATVLLMLATALNSDLSKVLVVLLPPLLLFLYFNFHPKRPARLFLGDHGSLWLGFLLAAMTLLLLPKKPCAAAGAAFLFLLPITDMTWITVSRIITGKVRSFNDWLEWTDRDHLHHHLLRFFGNRVWAVLALWTVALLTALLGFWLILASESLRIEAL